MLRIALVTREYPSLGAHGGIGTYTQNLVRGLARRGHDVTVIARGESDEVFYEDGATIAPVVVPERWELPFGNRHCGLSARALPFMQAAARRFVALDAEAPFDLVEVPEYQGWGLQVARAARCAVVVRLHLHTALMRRLNGAPETLDARLIAACEAATIRRGTSVLANSQALAQAVAKDYRLGPATPGVLPLGIDTERFSPAAGRGWLRNHLQAPAEAPIVLYVGRLERRKGVETLIEAFGQVAERHPEAILALAGFSTDTGPGRKALLGVLRERASQLGIAERVRFLGHVAYEHLPRYYAGCDLFVAPSIFEPFGMIYLEAMAAGRVAIGCQSGGAPEVIRDGETGLLVPPADAPALADALDRMLADPDRRRAIGLQARQEVLERFALPVIAARTEACYLQAIAARAGNRRAIAEAAHA